VDGFMLDLQDGKAMIKGNHDIENVAKLIQSVVLDTEDGRKKWLVEINITDMNVKREVGMSGVSGFSIGGAWDRTVVDGVGIISNIKLQEFSILYPTETQANRPANPESVPIMKNLIEFVERITFGIKSLNHKLRGTQMKEIEELQTSLKTMNESVLALTESHKGLDEKINSLKAEFQKSLEEKIEQLTKGLPETITGIITPMFDEQKKAQAETVTAIESEMKKSLDEKIDTVQKEMVKSKQIHENPPSPEKDTRSAWEKAEAWREAENNKQ